MEYSHKERSLICLTALKVSPGIKVAVHVKGKLQRYFCSRKHMALVTASMLLSLSSAGNKALQTETVQGQCCAATAVLSEVQGQAESFKKIVNCSKSVHNLLRVSILEKKKSTYFISLSPKLSLHHT